MSRITALSAVPQSRAPSVHSFPVRVYYEDTDAAGLVYYANYLKFAERARTEMLREQGADHAAMLRSTGLGFVVRHCEVDYLRPARLDDPLRVETRVLALGGATLDLRQDVIRDGEILVRMKVSLALLNSSGRPARLPPALRAALQSRCPTQE